MASFKSIRCGDQEDRHRQFDPIIGQSAAPEAVLEKVELVAPTTSSVLIQGETGTGKDWWRKRSTISVRATTVPL